MKRREENLKERRENEEIQKGRCSQFSFLVQEDVRKRHQKKKREERENSGFRQNKRGTNKKQKKERI